MQLEKVSLKQHIKVTMPDDFLTKVIYLCKRISEVEWSGVLFYEFKGSIQDPVNVEIILKDILLMHKGTTGYTEYSFDEKVVGFIMDNNYMSYKMGHIHSHAKLGVFFSGTDLDELNDNSEFHNFYLSLIVNNVLDMQAKIAFRAISSGNKVQYMAKNEKGEEYQVVDESIKTNLLCIYDCDLVTSIKNQTEVFKERVTEIIKIADEKFKNTTVNANMGLTRPNSELERLSNDTTDFRSPFWKSEDETEQDETDVIDLIIDDIYFDFAKYLLLLGNPQKEEDKDNDIETVIEDCMIAGYGETLPNSILEMYMSLYEHFFDNSPEAQSKEAFLETLENVISIFEDYEATYNYIGKLVLALKSFATKVSIG